MSSDFPTYGRGDDPAEPEPLSQYGGYAKPAAYGPGGYSQPQDPNQPHQGQPQPGQPPYGPPPPQYGQPPSYAGGPAGPGQPPGTGDRPSPYGPPEHPQQPLYGPPGHPQQPPYGPEPLAPQPVARDPRIARVLLITAIVSAVYGLLVLTVQRSALRDIAQAPGSPLNHPLRTDVIDTLGQLSVLALGGVSIAFWLRDLMSRRRAGRQPDAVEMGGLALLGIALVPLLVWVLMVMSTGMGADDDTLDRLPTAYGWGGMGLLLLALGFTLGYRTLRPPVSNPIVQPPPQRPPWA
jgi:hypothetical protein